MAAVAAKPPGGDLASPLSAVCRFWTEFDLEGVRSKLDGEGLKIAEHQEESMQNRKKLAESTKVFKKTAASDGASSKLFQGLLKQYQEEIDRLTKRAKHSESAFLELYQKLYEAPDPAPALSMAFETASRVSELETQCRKTTNELAEYKAEASSIKNQDLTIRKLEEKVRALEAQLEQKEYEVEEVKEQAVADADAARLQQMQEREAELTKMLAEAQSSLASMQKLHQATQNQLFAIQSQNEEEVANVQLELDLASTELERVQERMQALEQEKVQLVGKLGSNEGAYSTTRRDSQPGDKAQTVASTGSALSTRVEETLRHELSMQREMTSRLRSEVASLKREADEAHSMWESKLEAARSTLSATERHNKSLEEELQMRPTVKQMEELRSQLRVLQAVGYNTMDTDDGRPAGEGGTGGAEAGASGSLEAALMHKNRHLEHELTMSRLKAVDNKQALDAALTRVNDLEASLAEQQLLVARLEEDLASAGGGGGSAKMGSVPGCGASGGSTAAGGSQGKLSGLLLAAGHAESGELAEEEGGDSSMLRVLCSQRDRFRQKVIELEEELNRVRSELASAKSESAAARADNVALVERLRYVHGYKQQQRNAGTDVEVGADVEKRYARMYEDGINPFKEFQGQQRERQKNAMSYIDRAMYIFGQLVYGSPTARMFTFLYLALIHILVFASVTRLSHHTSHQLFAHQQHVLEHGRHGMQAALMQEEKQLP